MGNAERIEVEMTFLTTAEGGRSGPAENGYHPQFTCDGVGLSAAHTYVETNRAFPGETVRATITFYAAFPAVGLSVGKEFTIQEGSRVVARGHVTKIWTSATPAEPPV